MNRRTLSMILLLVAGVCVLAGAQDTLAVNVGVQVIASNPEASSVALANWADSVAVGGYFTLRSEDRVEMRIPPTRVSELRLLIEARGDTIVTYNPSAVDYREELNRNDAAIVSRNEALDRIMEYLADADVVATLSFERELRQLLGEIEYYEGRNRRIRNEVAYAGVVVYLSSRGRTIPSQRPSTFPWVNTVDLYRFLQEAQP